MWAKTVTLKTEKKFKLRFVFFRNGDSVSEKPFRLEPKNNFNWNRRTLVPRGQVQYKKMRNFVKYFVEEGQSPVERACDSDTKL